MSTAAASGYHEGNNWQAQVEHANAIAVGVHTGRRSGHANATMADYDDEPEEQVEGFEVFLGEAMKCILLVDGLPVVGPDNFEKLQKHFKSNSSLVKTWGSPPKKVEMPMVDGKTQGFAFLEFDSPVRRLSRPSPPSLSSVRTRGFAPTTT